MNILLLPDGSRRWAAGRNIGFDDGYAASVENLARTVELLHKHHIPELWVVVCTLKNLSRPPEQVSSFLRHFANLQKYTNIPLGFTVAGNEEALPEPHRSHYKKLPKATKATSFTVHYLLPWSIDDEILRLVNKFRVHDRPVTIDELLKASDIQKPIDLIIRAGRVSRLSAMIPWQSPYAELYFIDKLWPDVTGADIEDALVFYSQQERRKGL